jgi:type IV pilus assembly protein PilW
MIRPLATRKHRSLARARGFTLVEILVAITIALFLTGGLLTIVGAMRKTTTVQSGLSNLQDNERMAMTLLADVIQEAGYFPNPSANTATGEFPAIGPFTFAGQAVSLAQGQSFIGAGGFTDPPPPAASNIISVRFATAGTVVVAPAVPDNLINCTGNSTTYATTFVNTFAVIADATVPGTYDLVCQLQDSTAGGAPITVYLATGITQLQILYGVQTNTSVNSTSVDTYLDANGVNAGPYWNNVISVKLTLSFVNPLYGNLPGQSSTAPPTITFTRVIDIMNRTGGSQS